MQVSELNNVKIYNLSSGKTLPEWLSERKKRDLQKKDVDIRRRIELIQDFDMPAVSTSIRMSSDGQYILVTGIYKPRVKCFDVNHLSIKFERCLDSEVVTFQVISEDYSKLVFLQDDRYIEFHSAPGRYYRLRVPKFGRDLQYHYPSCDLFIVGASSDIYRLNLERGQFLSPFVSESSDINKCAVSPVHNLLVCGTREGNIEAWDPRTKSKVAVLDVALQCITESPLEGFPSVTAINFQSSLTMGVGTATGQVLLYDIRSSKPFFTKDHMYGLPIKNIEFENNQNLVLSMDSSVLKIWDKTSGKNFTSIESKFDFNDLHYVKNTGMLFIANENTKVQTYYIPSLGPAPRWCSFLDYLTEELEESKVNTVYDDYKFVTKRELEELGLSHLLGTTFLRAYMHGYFIDIRLYKKAKALSEPFAFEQYRKKKIREKIEEERKNRVKVQKLPNVNKDLAMRLLNDPQKTALLEDDRFGKLFNNPDFQIDTNAEEYRLIHPILSKLGKSKKEEQAKLLQQFEEVEDEPEGKNSSNEESSDEDDQEIKKELKKQHAIIRKEKRLQEREEKKLKFYELKEGEDYKGINQLNDTVNKASFENRLEKQKKQKIIVKGRGSREMKFTTRKKVSTRDQRMKLHQEERRSLHRSAMRLLGKERPKFWKGKRVA